MTDYTVISGNTVVELAKRVKVEADKGYEPLGGVAVTFNQQSASRVFYQAMIKN